MAAWNDYTVARHLRDYRPFAGMDATVLSGRYVFEGQPEDVVVVTFIDGFVFGNNSPFSGAKDAACRLLKWPYSRMRVIDVRMADGLVRTLYVAYRKSSK